MMLSKKFYTAKELAALLRMTAPTSVEKINQWSCAGKIRAYKVGRAWLFAEDDVVAFLRRQCNV